MNIFTRAFRLMAAISLCTASVAFAASDSSSLMNTVPTQAGTPSLKAYFPDQTTVPNVSSGGTYYSNLGNCPGDANPNTSKIIANSVPICPDINSYWPKNSGLPSNIAGTNSTNATTIATYCPEVCATHRKTVTSNYTLSGTTYTYVSSVTNAVCPTGYVQVAATDPDYEIAYNPSNLPKAHTVTDMVDYTTWTSQGMTCAPDTSKNFYWTYCDWSSNITKSSDTNSCTLGNVFYYKDEATGNLTFSQVTKCPAYSTQYSQGSACTIPWKVSSHSTKFYNQAAPIVCSIPSGYYYTNNTVPTTLVCARVKSVWNTRQ